MSDEKNSSYRGFTEAQARAHKKYIAQFVEIKVRTTPERRDEIKAHAAARGESVNGFIGRAIAETMERDDAATPDDLEAHRIAMEEYAAGQTVPHDAINWD